MGKDGEADVPSRYYAPHLLQHSISANVLASALMASDSVHKMTYRRRMPLECLN